MKSVGRFTNRMLSLVGGLLTIPGSSRIVRKIGSNFLSRRDISTKFLSTNIFLMLFLSNSSLMFLVNVSNLYSLRSCSRLLVAPYEL